MHASIVLGVLGGVAASAAAPSRVLAQEDAGDGQYRRLITLALEEFDAGRWAEARALFRRAHAISPNARTLRGIAMTSFELREYAAAIAHIDAALEHSERPLTERQRAHVLDLRSRAEAFVARYELDVTPRPARVLVDGVPVETDGPITVDLGEHTLRVVAAGRRPWERSVRVVGGERERLEVTLEPEASEGAPPPAALAPPEPVPPRDDTVAHVLFVGAGIGLAATAGAFGYWLESELDLGQCELRPCSNVGELRTLRDVGLGLTLGLGVVTVGLGIAGTVLLVDGPAGEPSSARLSCGVRGLGLGCHGQF